MAIMAERRILNSSGAERVLSLIIPVYYNAESLPDVAKAITWLEAELTTRNLGLEVIFVDDGSGDASLAELLKIKSARPATKIIKFTRNFGAVQAVRAGMRQASGDEVANMAADLHDPVEQVVVMVDAWLAGGRYVISVRRSRADPLLTRISARIYYRLIRMLVASDFPRKGYDFRLMDRAIANQHEAIPAYVNPIIFEFYLGFKPTVLEYDRRERIHGKSRWSFRKRLNLMLDTILGFSVRPLRLFSAIGALTAVASVIYGIFLIVATLLHGGDMPGFPTIVTLISFFFSLVLLMLGIIGEYIWRIFDRVTQKPESVIEQVFF
jgi:dolichol-phosphate mannosyltransferase